MFDNITNSLSKVFDTLAGKKILNEGHIDTAMREVRIALLEADVSLEIAKEFIKKVREKAVGQKVIRDVNPTQMIIKIVNDELVELLGSEFAEIDLIQRLKILLHIE